MKSSCKENLKPSKSFYLFVLAIAFFVICQCKSYDPKLMTPDYAGHGYNLTPLGSLVYGPWQTNYNKYNVTIDSNGKELSSIANYFTQRQRNLIFLLNQDGSVQYWFKPGYDSTKTETASAPDNEIHQESHDIPKEGEIKDMHKGGKWKANFDDSTLMIDFGKNAFGLQPLIGKYAELGAGTIYLKQIAFFDSSYNNNKVTLRRTISIRFTH